MKNPSWLQAVKFTAFSLSAGVIQLGSCELMLKVFGWSYPVSYLISLTLSVVWNFTLNREYTFRSAANIPVAMAKVFGFYLVFTPLSTWLGTWATNSGWNEDVVLILTMVSNFVLEFLFCKFVVYRNQENTK